MPYTREIPRDLFNEAKLLKCLGQLALLIHDGKIGGRPLRMDHDGQAFDIDQDDSDGSILCPTVKVFCGQVRVLVQSPLNSRQAYPLIFRDAGWENSGQVFNDDGTLSDEFGEFLDSLTVAR